MERGSACARRGDCRRSVRQDGSKKGQRSYDAGKKIKGRKRHIAVDTQGNLLAVVVHSAGIQDRAGAKPCSTSPSPTNCFAARLVFRQILRTLTRELHP